MTVKSWILGILSGLSISYGVVVYADRELLVTEISALRDDLEVQHKSLFGELRECRAKLSDAE